MWLLNANNRKLEYFNSEMKVPKSYAILSHTWGNEEVTFDEINTLEATRKIGYRKIKYSCHQVIRDGFTYVWVDTCCIDKRSSAELSEAINSMFRWYSNARICYAYLADVDMESLEGTDHENQFRESRWFDRGWTLQELIAPEDLRFFDKNWQQIGSKKAMLVILNQITHIPEAILAGQANLSTASVAQRMSWASKRSTTRVEDEAYCLLGIFDVNMPMLYGEGKKAFRRLQEEMIRSSSSVDHSILAWSSRFDHTGNEVTILSSAFLSSSPHDFRHAGNILSWALPQDEIFEISRMGLRVNLPVASDPIAARSNASTPGHLNPGILIALNCRYKDEPGTRIIVSLRQRPHVEELDVTDRRLYRSLRGESVYDRTTRSERLFGFLANDHNFGIQKNIWQIQTLTLARQQFRFPDHGSRVHVSLKSCQAKLDQNSEWEPPMLAVTHWRNGHVLYGALMIEFPTGVEGVYTSARVEIYIISKRRDENPWPTWNALGPPLLTIALVSTGSVSIEDNEALYQSGETRHIPYGGLGREFKVSARYVNLAEEFLWSIEIEADISEVKGPVISA